MKITFKPLFIEQSFCPKRNRSFVDLEFYFDFASMISVGISLPSQPTDFSKFDTIFDKSGAKNFLFVSLANIFRLVVLQFFWFLLYV